MERSERNIQPCPPRVMVNSPGLSRSLEGAAAAAAGSFKGFEKAGDAGVTFGAAGTAAAGAGAFSAAGGTAAAALRPAGAAPDEGTAEEPAAGCAGVTAPGMAAAASAGFAGTPALEAGADGTAASEAAFSSPVPDVAEGRIAWLSVNRGLGGGRADPPLSAGITADSAAPDETGPADPSGTAKAFE